MFILHNTLLKEIIVIIYRSGLLLFSLVNLCTDFTNKLQIYLEYFEKAYLDATREFYTSNGQQYLADNGVQNYMKYVSLGMGP